MRYLLGFSTITDRQKLAQVKTFVEIAHSLHNNVGQRPAFRLKRKFHCMSAVNKTIESCTLVESIRRGSPWRYYFDDQQENITTVILNLSSESIDWAVG